MLVREGILSPIALMLLLRTGSFEPCLRLDASTANREWNVHIKVVPSIRSRIWSSVSAIAAVKLIDLNQKFFCEKGCF